jgi:molybdenum cofactor synthesis domain-containing protein
VAIPAVSQTAAVLTVSDGVSHGTRRDESGDSVEALLAEAGFNVVARRVVPDEHWAIVDALTNLGSIARLVVTTGGTGFGPRDVTPEATRTLLDKEAPGIQHLMLSDGIQKTPMAALSRGLAGAMGSTFILNLPGSPRGATENLQSVVSLVPHVLDLLEGQTEH